MPQSGADGRNEPPYGRFIVGLKEVKVVQIRQHLAGPDLDRGESAGVQTNRNEPRTISRPQTQLFYGLGDLFTHVGGGAMAGGTAFPAGAGAVEQKARGQRTLCACSPGREPYR